MMLALGISGPITRSPSKHMFVVSRRHRINMEVTQRFEGVHSTTSPDGERVACLIEGRLRLQHIQAPHRPIDLGIKTVHREVTTLKWCVLRHLKAPAALSPEHCVSGALQYGASKGSLSSRRLGERV